MSIDFNDTVSAEERLQALAIELPILPAPLGNYVDAQRDGTLVYLSGKGPLYADGQHSCGKVGADVSVETAYRDARQTGINLLAALRTEIGSLDKVERVVKLLGLVNSVPEFADHPKVIDGCSDLLIEVFADRGRHARSAIGVSSLPVNITVEIEMIVRIKSDDS